MAPFIILVLVILAVVALRAVGITRIPAWPFAVQCGVAAMFVATGVSHFVGMRDELIAMVPPAIPAPGVVVTVTGALELAGAVGILWRRTALWAAGGLTLMLIGMYPANVYAANQGISPSFGDALVPRTLMQIVFLAATVTVLVHYARARRALGARDSVGD
ncbi:DoxX family protein [Saccharomonospora xinjiangensis]|uniref:Putative membrane protein n=1 Tax=Saccharomonospora xinjiangensis XJ-54 TaxID=882086 RepID=I0V8D1_9PSEU|nr:DoxX family protein [Saccharomonospora xinjiangensis]EID56384.1 putative membrane protein [Saccharomonospora xinjiangensis XJ-54]